MKARTKTALKWVGLGLVFFPFLLWGCAAIWFDGPLNRLVAGALVFCFAAMFAVIVWRVRPVWKAAGAMVLAVACVLGWWLLISPRNDRVWAADVAQLASATIDGNRATIRNVRNFEFRSREDFTENWETREYDLDTIRGFDMYLCYWGPKFMAHTIASWEFADGRHLAISVEIRREEGEAYNALRGLFRQFEIYYLVGDERDLIGSRAAIRGHQVYLYRVEQSPETARALLEDYLAEINRLEKKAQWYNGLKDNCTTSIRQRMKAINAVNAWDWRILVNGYLDEMAYERGSIETSLPFEEMKSRSDVTEKAKAAIDHPDFSLRIREGLPGERQKE